MRPENIDDESRRPTSVVVPCYNEADRFDADAFVSFAASRPWLRWVFVDDGSDDATAQALDDVRGRLPDRTAVVSLSHNRGKSEAVRRGVTRALRDAPELVGFWDADLATPLAEIDRFRERFEQQPELQIVIGSRVKLLGRRIERSEIRHYFGRVAATAVSWILEIAVYDTQCGAKLFRVGPGLESIFAEPFVSRWAFDVEILARWLIGRESTTEVDRSMIEVPLREWIDVPGSKLTASDFLGAPWDLWRIWRRYGAALSERARRDR